MGRARRLLATAVGFALAASLGPAAPASARPIVEDRFALGESVRGRTIEVHRMGSPGEIRILVVGCIHGEECAGLRIVERLLGGDPPSYFDLWVLPNLNPDGYAANTRGNAHGVDLNRNFPYGWEPLPRGRYYAGPRPGSEPETKIAMRLISRIEPDVTIWYHQPFGIVDLSGGDESIERRYARLVGMRVEELGPRPGTATSWQHDAFPGTTAFVVELPGGALGPAEARVHADAVLELFAPNRRRR